jgi:hypothetical protein
MTSYEKWVCSLTDFHKLLIGLGTASGLGLLWRLISPSVEWRLHVLNGQKFVDADPKGLARAAGVPLDVYALASAMQSEEKTRIGHIAIGCAVRNYCRKHKISIAAQLLKGRGPSHGHFGSQETGKWASTSKPPTANTLILAGQILQSPSPIVDPTQGAVRWYAPAMQDAAHQRNPNLYSLDSEQLKTKLMNAGGKMIFVPGVPDTIFWTV